MSRTIASIDPKTNGLFKSGFFAAARQPIQTHLQNAINEQDYPLALDTFTNLTRIHLEMEDKANIDELLLQIGNYEAFSEYVENESKFHYSMALIAFYFSKTDLAFQKIDRALQ